MTETTVYANYNREITRVGDRWMLYQITYGINSLEGEDYLDKADMNALREFFQAEEDKRLNRWRHPDHPGLLVYPDSDYPLIRVVVLDEVTPGRTVVVDKYSLRATGPEDRAAEAYFDAHPEPKPWHDAKEGEAWVLTIYGDEGAAVVTENGNFRSSTGLIEPTSKNITTGYRIYPEGDS